MIKKQKSKNHDAVVIQYVACKFVSHPYIEDNPYFLMWTPPGFTDAF
jgi:hypothetical protein